MQKPNYLIIGGSSGIGLEIVKALLETDAAVYVASRSKDSLRGLPITRHIALDVSDFPQTLEPLPETLQGLVYCPGTIHLKPFPRLKPDDFFEDFRINLIGAVQSIQACLSRLKKSRDGAAVVLFSTVAVQTGMPFHASIAAAKGAVEGLTRALAAELAPRIRVNAIAPSLTQTPLAGDLLATEEKQQAAAERHPMKRFGSPSEMAAAAVMLLSETSAWMTGQILHIDGGMSSIRTFR